MASRSSVGQGNLRLPAVALAVGVIAVIIGPVRAVVDFAVRLGIPKVGQFGSGQQLDDALQQVVNAVVVVGGYERRFVHAQPVEFGGGDFPVVVVNLVDGQHHGLVGAAEALRHRLVGSRQSLDGVGDEHDDVGRAHGHVGLLLHALGDVSLRVVL